MSVLWRFQGTLMMRLAKVCNMGLKAGCVAISFGLFAGAGQATTPARSPAEQVRSGFKVAQACEGEIDDDLTAYGECVGHAADRLAGQRLGLLGLHFQAWMMADLAARQGGTRSSALRARYQRALEKSLRANGWTVKQLCEVKQLMCSPVELRLAQKL